MKVYIGPYTNWIGPYQIADWLQVFGMSEGRCHKVGDWLASTWVRGACEWVHSKKKRTVRVKIHDYDCWGLDHTLAHIILPALLKLQEQKHGVPMIMKTPDVPEELWPESDDDWCGEKLNHELLEARWNYIIGEMVWAFRVLLDDDLEVEFWKYAEFPVIQAHEARVANGLRLFGVYYQALWD